MGSILKMFRPDGKIDVKYFQKRLMNAMLEEATKARWVVPPGTNTVSTLYGGMTVFNPPPKPISK